MIIVLVWLLKRDLIVHAGVSVIVAAFRSTKFGVYHIALVVGFASFL